MTIIPFLNRSAPFALDPAIALLGNEPQGAAFDFINGRAWIRDRETPVNNFLGDVNNLLTYASPSPKWIFNRHGVLESGTALRCDHDPVTGEKLGILVEGQRTNWLINSNTLASFGGGIQLLKSDSGVPSPIPGINYRRIEVATTGKTTHHQTVAGVGSAAGNVFTCFVKKGETAGGYEPNRFGVRNDATSTDLLFPTFNYDTGIFSGAGAEYASAEAMRDGGWRIQLRVTSGVSNGDTLSCYVGYTGSLFSQGTWVLCAGAQLEVGPMASSYIPTEASAVTRANDNITLPTSAFGYDSAQGTIVAEFTNFSGNDATVIFGVAYVTDGTTTNALGLYRYGNNAGFAVSSGGVKYVDTRRNIAGQFDQVFKAAAAWNSGRAIACINGVLTPPDTSLTLPLGANLLNIGRRVATNELFGHIRRLCYFPRTLSDAELIARSAA